MSWLFGKKKGDAAELPQLPKLPEAPELPPLPDFEENSMSISSVQKSKVNLPTLPAFPNSAAGQKMNDAIVKTEVGRDKPSLPSQGVFEIPKLPESSRKPVTPMVMEMDVKNVDFSSKPASASYPRTRSTEPVFVRIDKYQDSLDKLQEIKKRLLEIDSLLKDIKELKSKEEAELENWEEEMQDAKSKLDLIDRALFQKLD